MTRFRLMAALVAGGVFSSCVGTTTYAGNSLTLYPNSPGVTGANGASGTSAPGFGTGSFQANGTSKAEIYISASSLFTTPVMISDIASISYFTNKPGDATAVDWTFYMYTNLQTSGNSASWFHTRLNSEPYFSSTPSASAPANAWNEWSTGGSNPMKLYDQPRSGTFGTYTDPTLADLKAGPVTWNGSRQTGATVDYRSEVINLFSFQTGSDWANGFNGKLDGFTIKLTSGDTAKVNFEATAVPEPATLALASSAGLVLGVGSLIRRRRKANAV